MKIYRVCLARLSRETRTAIVVVEDGEELSEDEITERAWERDEDTDPQGTAWFTDVDWGVDEGTHTVESELRLLGPEDEPKVGDLIYVGPSDDIHGGLATVSVVKDSMSAGEMVPFISIEILPNTSYNWASLAERQEKLAKDYKDRWAKVG